MSRPEYATTAITKDLRAAEHALLIAIESATMRQARALTIQYKRLVSVRNRFTLGLVPHVTAIAFAESGKRLADHAKEQQ